MISKLVSFLSAEWLLSNRDNGGALILLRAIFISTLLFLSIIALVNILDSGRSMRFSFAQLRLDMIEYISWWGVLFGSAYAALYSRFASQWAYLASLYNQIKEAECNPDTKGNVLAEWKAGFIEDAEYLHLAHKENFASIIHAWTQKEEVCQKYIEFTPGGEKRLNSLRESVGKRYLEICNKNSK